MERLDGLRAELDKRRKRLERITLERLDAEPGSEAERALLSAADTTENEIRSLGAQLVELEARPAPGISEDDAHALERFAAEVRDGIVAATPADRRRVYELLRLRGQIGPDPENGVKLGRLHRFRVVYEAIIPIDDDGRRFW